MPVGEPESCKLIRAPEQLYILLLVVAYARASVLTIILSNNPRFTVAGPSYSNAAG